MPRRPANVLDYRALAKARLPRFLFEYVDGGSYGEVTLRRNISDLENVVLRQRVMRDVSAIDTSAELLGQQWAMPVGLGPVGLSGLFAALAGLFYAAKTGSGDPTVGRDYILPSLAAVVIGGTSLAGGRGGLVGTLLGVIILNFIGDVVFLLQLPSYWQPVATGLILVLVVIASSLVDRLTTRGLAEAVT